LQELAMEEANVWFVRFSMDLHCRLLACGSRTGRVFLWEPDAVTPHPKHRIKRPSGSNATVRRRFASLHVSLSPCR